MRSRAAPSSRTASGRRRSTAPTCTGTTPAARSSSSPRTAAAASRGAEFADDVGAVVNMTFGPSPQGQGLYYTNYDGGGEVRRIESTASSNRAPTARVTASPTSGAVPLAVSFDGSTSTDPDAGDTLTYIWNFGDGSAVATTASATTSHTYTTAGTYHGDAHGARQPRSVVARRTCAHRSGQHGAAGDDQHPDRRATGLPSARRSPCMRPRPTPRTARWPLPAQLGGAPPPRHAHASVPRADGRERHPDHAAGARGPRLRDQRLSRDPADGHGLGRGDDDRDPRRPAEPGEPHVLDQSGRPRRRRRRHDLHRAEDAHLVAGVRDRGRCSDADRRLREHVELPDVVRRRCRSAHDRDAGRSDDLHRDVRPELRPLPAWWRRTGSMPGRARPPRIRREGAMRARSRGRRGVRGSVRVGVELRRRQRLGDGSGLRARST